LRSMNGILFFIFSKGHILKDHNFYSHHCENLKSQGWNIVKLELIILCWKLQNGCLKMQVAVSFETLVLTKYMSSHSVFVCCFDDDCRYSSLSNLGHGV
jgi:hypothetical protein